MLTLTAPAAKSPPPWPDLVREEAALQWYALALDNLVGTLQRNPWHTDNEIVGPHAAILAQARADRDAAHAAHAAAVAARNAPSAWVRPL
jgi:hypothetical protein